MNKKINEYNQKVPSEEDRSKDSAENDCFSEGSISSDNSVEGANENGSDKLSNSSRGSNKSQRSNSSSSSKSREQKDQALTASEKPLRDAGTPDFKECIDFSNIGQNSEESDAKITAQEEEK